MQSVCLKDFLFSVSYCLFPEKERTSEGMLKCTMHSYFVLQTPVQMTNFTWLKKKEEEIKLYPEELCPYPEDF